jgi:hypothetical protein
MPLALSVGAPISAVMASSSLAAKAVILVSAATIAAGGGAVAYRIHARSEARPARVFEAPRAVRAPAPDARVPVAPSAVQPSTSTSAPASALAPVMVSRSRPPARRWTSAAYAFVPPAPAPGAEPAPAAPLAPALEPSQPPLQRAPLAREIALLDAAEQAERRHDHRAALSSLDEYARAFPGGALMAEAQVLRIAALLGIGAESVAREQARLFLSRYAPSPLAARVRSMLSEQSRQTKEPP